MGQDWKREKVFWKEGEEGFSGKRERMVLRAGGSRKNELEKGEEGEENLEVGGRGKGVAGCLGCVYRLQMRRDGKLGGMTLESTGEGVFRPRAVRPRTS